MAGKHKTSLQPIVSINPFDSRWLFSDGSLLLFLGILDYLVFSDSFSQFFQGDALFYRFRSWNEFFHTLVDLDAVPRRLYTTDGTKDERHEEKEGWRHH